MKNKFLSYILLFFLLIFFSVALFANDFKVIFIKEDGANIEYNTKEIEQIDFSAFENEYSVLIYAKSGLSELNSKLTNQILFTDSGIEYKGNDGSSNTLDFSMLDSIKLKKISPVKEIKELVIDEVILQGLLNPWSIAFIDNDNLLFTERAGKLYQLNLTTKVKTEITGLPKVSMSGQAGLLDIKLHPKYGQNKLVYFSYVLNTGNSQAVAVMRAKLENNRLTDTLKIFQAIPAVSSSINFGSRILFDQSNYLYISVGDRGIANSAQDASGDLGKLIRLNDDGSIPADNPFVDKSGYRPEIWTIGHRNIQGLEIHPVTGEIWAHEHGPKGGDELNLIKKGANYGWPLATFGVNYDGSIITKDTTYPGCEDPITYWVPSIAPCGMAFVKENTTETDADILIGALAGKHIERLHLRNNKVIKRINSLQDYARFRDIKQSPDGRIFAITENPGTLIRLKEK